MNVKPECGGLWQVMVDQAQAFKVHGVALKGKLTCGENVADLGGLKLAYGRWVDCVTAQLPSPNRFRRQGSSSRGVIQYPPALSPLVAAMLQRVGQ